MSDHSQGLTRNQRLNARRLAKNAALLHLKNAKAVHYSQGPGRWEGIDRNMKAYQGEYPKHTDCSGSSTWYVWNGLSHYKNLDHYDFEDTANGCAWQRGYTGTMITHGEKIAIKRSKLKRGDFILYGDPYGSTGHVAMYVGYGMVISHGSEAGPFLIPWNYRPVTGVRRAI
jgi:cell wall-associated NlpC family hydrolase